MRLHPMYLSRSLAQSIIILTFQLVPPFRQDQRRRIYPNYRNQPKVLKLQMEQMGKLKLNKNNSSQKNNGCSKHIRTRWPDILAKNQLLEDSSPSLHGLAWQLMFHNLFEIVNVNLPKVTPESNLLPDSRSLSNSAIESESTFWSLIHQLQETIDIFSSYMNFIQILSLLFHVHEQI